MSRHAGSTVQRPATMVLVHPGSACGSADFNLGKFEARAARAGLVQALDRWQGGLVVIDGEFSDELVAHRALSESIAQALQRAATSGQWSCRVFGDDPDQVDRIRELVTAMGAAALTMDFEVTGAWLHGDGSGCVGSVIDELRRLGCQAFAHDSAVVLDWGDHDEEAVDGDPVVPGGAGSDRSMRSRDRG